MFNFSKSAVIDSFKSAYLDSINKSVTIIDNAFEKAEKIAAINLNTAKDSIDKSMSNFKNVFEVKSASEASSFVSNSIKSSALSTQEYVKRIHEVVTTK